jgi:SAM-dependent methyltransferase
MPGAGPVRVLSLCAGAARFEAQFAAAAGAGARWTLLDLSEGLLREAARNFPEGITPTLVAADLNEVADFGERFDVVMCVSGLHHIVELERVVDFVHDVLVDDGEFWSIGEAVGRSGNRLFAGDYRVANAFFRGLPARLRRNRLGGEPDENLPNVDYSDATFEGIRSDEIEPLLAHRLEAVQVYRRNCFLWRLVDLAYADNYDLANADDIAWIHRAVDAELAHYRAGGHPTELHGVYRKRRY